MVPAEDVGSVLGGYHPAGTIHLRLKGADDILKKAKEENEDIYDDLPMADGEDPKTKDVSNVEGALSGGEDGSKEERVDAVSPSEAKDMLVMRLDESIARALERIKELCKNSSPFVVNESMDALASEIEALEEKSKKEWVDNHALIDHDGRARCSFHFCKKLFKDRKFLQKHLLKKHPEFLKAEIAKCHDSYMMKWWDEEVCRPVPQILVDCGSTFGLVPSSVSGSDKPTASDPEPDLWREEQDLKRRMEEEEEMRRQRRAEVMELAERQRKNSESRGETAGGPPMNDSVDPTFGGGGNRSSNFVDVDDMKDEKVELSFENVDVPIIPPKKKKKKKKKFL